MSKRHRHGSGVREVVNVQVSELVHTTGLTRTTKCRRCGRRYNEQEALERFAGMADDPFLTRKVLQELARQYQTPRIHEVVCGECALDLAEQARAEVEWTDPRGYFILTPDQERYGREMEGVATVPRRSRETTTMTDIDTAATSESTDATSNGAAPEGGEQTFPAAAPKTTSRDTVLAAFPLGALVEVATKGSDWVGQQGTIVEPIEKRGAWYAQVELTVSSTGRRFAAKTVPMRPKSLQAIDAFRPEPVKAEPAAAAASTDEPF